MIARFKPSGRSSLEGKLVGGGLGGDVFDEGVVVVEAGNGGRVDAAGEEGRPELVPVHACHPHPHHRRPRRRPHRLEAHR